MSHAVCVTDFSGSNVDENEEKPLTPTESAMDEVNHTSPEFELLSLFLKDNKASQMYLDLQKIVNPAEISVNHQKLNTNCPHCQLDLSLLYDESTCHTPEINVANLSTGLYYLRYLNQIIPFVKIE